MAVFYPTNITPDSFIRGPARLLIANITLSTPANIGDIINLTGTTTQYQAMAGWTDLGSTKTGVQISTNNTEENFDVDQILGDIDTLPTNWEASAGTQLADVSPTMLALVWEGTVAYQATSADGPRWRVGYGQPVTYSKRKLAVLHQKSNGLIRAHLFHRVTRTAQESAVTYNKTGEQQSLPMRFRALADTSISDVYDRFFITLDQVAGP